MAVARYSDPWLRYRDGTIYRGEAAEEAPAFEASLPLRPGVALRFYDSNGLLTGIASSEWGAQLLLTARAQILPSGPGKMDFSLAALPSAVTIQHGTRVDLHLWGAADPVYSGTVQILPSALSTERPFKYTAAGYSAQLQRPIIPEETFASQRIYDVVDDLAQAYINGATGILYHPSGIERTATYRAGDLQFKKETLKRALDQLSAMAGLFVYGVGADRVFFFRKEETEVYHHWIIGTHVATCDADEDDSQVGNRAWIQMGKRSALNGDQWLPDALEDLDSQRTYGVREFSVKAPAVFSESDAVRMAAVELARRKDAVVRIRLTGIPFSGTPIECRGRARVLSQDGTAEETRPFKSVTYTCTGSRVEVSVDLGDREPDPGRWLAEFSGQQARLEQLQQAAQRQTAVL